MKASERKYPGYIVYLYWQPDADKMYVGITKTGCIDDRAKGGRGYIKKCPHLSNAIEKYGWESFAKEVLQYGLTKEEAEEWERYYIAKWDLQNPDKGYNIKSGGHCGTGMSDEGRRALSEKQSAVSKRHRAVCAFNLDGDKIGEFPMISLAADCYGIKVKTLNNSLRRGKYLCNNLLFLYKDDVGLSDKIPQDRLLQYISKKNRTGINSSQSKRVSVFDFDTGELISVFESAKEASAFCGASVQGVLLGRQIVCAKKYIARYFDEVGNLTILPEEMRYVRRKSFPSSKKPVARYSPNGDLIEMYSSISDASRKCGVSRAAISDCLNGVTNFCSGFIWRFHKE